MGAFWGGLLYAFGGAWGVTPVGIEADHVNLGSRICAGALMMQARAPAPRAARPWVFWTKPGVLSQAALLLFNLCTPAYPLDGGRIIVDAMCLGGTSLGRAARVSGALSFVIGAFLCVYGLVLTFWYFSINSSAAPGAPLRPALRRCASLRSPTAPPAPARRSGVHRRLDPEGGDAGQQHAEGWHARTAPDVRQL